MHVEILPHPAAVAERAFALVRAAVRCDPELTMGFPTGGTPEALYRRMAEAQGAGAADFSRIRLFHLDEYLGLPADHSMSYRRYLMDRVVGPLALCPERVHLLDGTAADPAGHAAAYENEIRAVGGIDLQLLGIGANGHIAFNEPGTSLGSRTGVRTLTRRTRTDNARFFDDPTAVPTHALSMGIGTILEARHLLVLCTGAHKATAVRGMLEGPVRAVLPASAVQLHPRAMILADAAAAGELELDHHNGVAEPRDPGRTRRRDGHT